MGRRRGGHRHARPTARRRDAVRGELLTGFVARLATIDLDQPRICGRLIDAGARAVKRARQRAADTDAIRVDAAWSLPPHHPWDHPDWVLARAVAAAVIDPDECLLISATRLDERPLQAVADKLGIPVAVAAAWRRKAERRLATAIHHGEMSGLALRATFDRSSDATARLNGLSTVPRQSRQPLARQCVQVSRRKRTATASSGPTEGQGSG